MKRAKKHSAISLYDYPRNNYSAYWEILVNETPKGKTTWKLRIVDYSDSRVLETHDGMAADEEDARRQSQALVGKLIVKYKRKEPLETIDADKAAALTAEFNALRSALQKARPEERGQLFPRIDRIRGLLKANGYKLDEPESILAPDPATVTNRSNGWLSRIRQLFAPTA